MEPSEADASFHGIIVDLIFFTGTSAYPEFGIVDGIGWTLLTFSVNQVVRIPTNTFSEGCTENFIGLTAFPANFENFIENCVLGASLAHSIHKNKPFVAVTGSQDDFVLLIGSTLIPTFSDSQVKNST